MYAIIDDGQRQFKVEQGTRFEVELQDIDEGQKTYVFDRLLMIGGQEAADRRGATWAVADCATDWPNRRRVSSAAKGGGRGGEQKYVASRIAYPVLWVGSVAPAMPEHRQAAVTPSRGPDKRPFGRACGPLGRRRAGLVMRYASRRPTPLADRPASAS